jgi:uncharacterized protein YndB with AHSA1/START domain
MAAPPRPLFEKTLRFEVRPERVFAALSEAEQLIIWFAEQAEVAPRLHGSYAFWGKYTLWNERRVSGGQYITRFEAPGQLSYRWELAALPTEVHLDLEGSERRSTLRLRHELLAEEADAHTREMLADYWRIALLNLGWYLETGGPMLRLDYTRVQGDVALEMNLAAPPPQVYQTLTLPARMDAWLSRQAKVELRVGGLYDFGWTETVDGVAVPAGPTVLKSLEQDRLLAYGWRWPGLEGETLVRWELSPAGSGSRVALTHSGFAPDRDSTDYKQGWGAFLCLLKLYLERGLRWE